MLRPACRRCTARRGIAEPVACHLPPLRTVCRRHRLWIGPSARTHAGQLDVSQLPEILHAQRRRLAQLDHHHQWRQVDTAISDATHTIRQALRAGGSGCLQVQVLSADVAAASSDLAARSARHRRASGRKAAAWPGAGAPIWPHARRFSSRRVRRAGTLR
jgi:hypothetical protein